MISTETNSFSVCSTVMHSFSLGLLAFSMSFVCRINLTNYAIQLHIIGISETYYYTTSLNLNWLHKYFTHGINITVTTTTIFIFVWILLLFNRFNLQWKQKTKAVEAVTECLEFPPPLAQACSLWCRC